MTGRAHSGQALAVPATPASAVDGPSGFDPSRGVPRQTLVNIGRDCIRFHPGADCDCEIIGMLRDHANRLIGGNCTFADGDLRILVTLSERAIDAGLTGGLHPTVARNLAIATEARRAETDSDMGLPITENGSVHEGAGLKGIAQTEGNTGTTHKERDNG